MALLVLEVLWFWVSEFVFVWQAGEVCTRQTGRAYIDFPAWLCSEHVISVMS
jgi:hypothetical protein